MQLAANVTSGDQVDWQAIDWKRVHRTVKNLRQRLFRASREGDLKRVRSLQRLMLRCQANVLESVRRVTQVNRGKDTPGVDRVVVTTPEEKGRLCDQLSQLDLHHVLPVRRVYIPSAKAKGRWAFPPSSIDAFKPWCKTPSIRSGKLDLRGSVTDFARAGDATMRSRKSFAWPGRTPRGLGS